MKTNSMNLDKYYWPFTDLAITDIMLDGENIRLSNPSKAQPALIQDLFSNEDAFDLAKSYSQNGRFSDEFPIVIFEKRKYIAIEGNRRLAALKALNEPDLVPAYKDKIKALKNPKITHIRVILAPNKTEALKHIANKHTVNYRRPWKPLRQAYFYQSQIQNGKAIDKLIEEFPDHDIPRFIKMLDMHRIAKSIDFDEKDVQYKIHDDKKFPISSLERMYENKSVQEFLGFGFDEKGKVKININKSEFEKGYKYIVKDIATGEIDSRKTNTGKQIEAYLKTIPDNYIPDTETKGRSSAVSFKEKKVDFNESTTKKGRSDRASKGLYKPSNIPYNLGSSAIRYIYNELRDINVRDFPNATHDLLRTFIETTLAYNLKEKGEYSLLQSNPKHILKLSEMLTYISSDKCTWIHDPNIKQIVEHIKSNYDKPYSLIQLNMGNHNEHMTFQEKDVRHAWSKIESLMKLLLNPSKKK